MADFAENTDRQGGEVALAGQAYETETWKPLCEYEPQGLTVFLNISGSPAALTVVSGATFTPGPLAAGSLASALGIHLAGGTSSANPPVSPLAGVTISVLDATGVAREALLLRRRSISSCLPERRRDPRQ